jgi:hypothetical protein
MTFPRSPYIYRKLKRLDWLKTFNGNEIRALVFLQEISNTRDIVTKFSAGDRANMCVFVGVARKTLSVVLRALEEKRTIVMLNRNELVVHPDYYILKETKLKRHRVDLFDSVYARKHPAPGVNIKKTFIVRTKTKYE